MKRIAHLALIGTAALAVAAGAQAQTWEQNLNIALVAQVQTSTGTVKKVALNSKAIIALLGNINSQVTNNFDLFVTNTPATPERLPVFPFPDPVVVNDNYVVDVGGQSFTNNIDFTNTVTFTRTNTNPVTYVFNNAVPINSTITGFFVPDFPRDVVSAELVDLVGPGYHLSNATVTTNNTPTFSSSAKLLIIEDLNTGIDRFVVRDGPKGSAVDTDVSPFFGVNTFQQVVQSRSNGSATLFSHIDFFFNDSKGDTFDTQGMATENDAPLKVRGTSVGRVRKTLTATLGGSGALATAAAFNGPMVLSGKININGGKFVAAPQ